MLLRTRQSATGHLRKCGLSLVLVVPALLGWFVCGVAQAGESPSGEFRLIVNPDNPIGAAPREFLTELFLKKVTRWSNGEGARPIDQIPASAVRRQFSVGILRRPVSAVRSYWQQHIFSGRGVPPPELESDEAVVSYVLKERGAIGYVSSAAKLGRVKVIAVR